MDMIITACSICFKGFTSYPSQKRQTCSLKCLRVWRSILQDGKLRNSVKKKCVTCGDFFYIRRSHAAKRIGCSLKCMGIWRSKFMRGPRASNWRGGISQRAPYGDGFTPQLKKEILKRDGQKCRVCSASNFLFVHHRNGVKKDNSKRNLIVLCAKCHRSVHRKFEVYLILKYGMQEKGALNQVLVKMLSKR